MLKSGEFLDLTIFNARFPASCPGFLQKLIKRPICENNRNLRRCKMPSKAPHCSLAGIFFKHDSIA